MKNIILNQIKTIFNLLKTIPDNIYFDDQCTFNTQEKSIRINTNVFKCNSANVGNFASQQHYQYMQSGDSARISITIQNNQAMPNFGFQSMMGYNPNGMANCHVPGVQYIAIEYTSNSGLSLNGVTYNCDEAEAIEKIYLELDKVLEQYLNPVTYYFYWNDGRRTSTNKTGTIAEIMEAEGYPNWKKELTCYAEAVRDRNLVWDTENKAWQF